MQASLFLLTTCVCVCVCAAPVPALLKSAKDDDQSQGKDQKEKQATFVPTGGMNDREVWQRKQGMRFVMQDERACKRE